MNLNKKCNNQKALCPSGVKQLKHEQQANKNMVKLGDHYETV